MTGTHYYKFVRRRVCHGRVFRPPCVCPGGVQLAERTREAAGQRSELGRLQQRSAQLVEELAGQEDRSRVLATELSRLHSTSSHSQDEVNTQDTHTSHTHHMEYSQTSTQLHCSSNMSPNPRIQIKGRLSRSHLASSHPCSHVH